MTLDFKSKDAKSKVWRYIGYNNNQGEDFRYFSSNTGEVIKIALNSLNVVINKLNNSFNFDYYSDIKRIGPDLSLNGIEVTDKSLIEFIAKQTLSLYNIELTRMFDTNSWLQGILGHRRYMLTSNIATATIEDISYMFTIIDKIIAEPGKDYKVSGKLYIYNSIELLNKIMEAFNFPDNEKLITLNKFYNSGIGVMIDLPEDTISNAKKLLSITTRMTCRGTILDLPVVYRRNVDIITLDNSNNEILVDTINVPYLLSNHNNLNKVNMLLDTCKPKKTLKEVLFDKIEKSDRTYVIV